MFKAIPGLRQYLKENLGASDEFATKFWEFCSHKPFPDVKQQLQLIAVDEGVVLEQMKIAEGQVRGGTGGAMDGAMMCTKASAVAEVLFFPDFLSYICCELRFCVERFPSHFSEKFCKKLCRLRLREKSSRKFCGR